MYKKSNIVVLSDIRIVIDFSFLEADYSILCEKRMEKEGHPKFPSQVFVLWGSLLKFGGIFSKFHVNHKYYLIFFKI